MRGKRGKGQRHRGRGRGASRGRIQHHVADYGAYADPLYWDNVPHGKSGRGRGRGRGRGQGGMRGNGRGGYRSLGFDYDAAEAGGVSMYDSGHEHEHDLPEGMMYTERHAYNPEDGELTLIETARSVKNKRNKRKRRLPKAPSTDSSDDSEEVIGSGDAAGDSDDGDEVLMQRFEWHEDDAEPNGAYRLTSSEDEEQKVDQDNVVPPNKNSQSHTIAYERSVSPDHSQSEEEPPILRWTIDVKGNQNVAKILNANKPNYHARSLVEQERLLPVLGEQPIVTDIDIHQSQRSKVREVNIVPAEEHISLHISKKQMKREKKLAKKRAREEARSRKGKEIANRQSFKDVIIGPDLYIDSDEQPQESDDGDVQALIDYIENAKTFSDADADQKLLNALNAMDLPEDMSSEEDTDVDAMSVGALEYDEGSLSDFDDDDLAREYFNGHNHWDEDMDTILADTEDMKLEAKNALEVQRNAEKQFKAIIKGSFDQVPSTLHGGFKARLQRAQSKSRTSYSDYGGRMALDEDYANRNSARHNQQLLDQVSAKLGRRDRKLERSQRRKGKVETLIQDVDRAIQRFIRNDSLQTLKLEPMAPYHRRLVHMLAQAYNLKSASSGSKLKRFPTLTKTPRTRLPADRSHIDGFIALPNRGIRAPGQYLHATEPNGTGRKGKKRGDIVQEDDRNMRRSASHPGVAHGQVVGGNVAPISSSNVGHRMLSAMGWTEGQGIGVGSGGITSPVEAIVKKGRKGLGHGMESSQVRLVASNVESLRTKTTVSARLEHDQVVASGAEPIGSSNVGHRLLSAMGWSEGQGIGSSSSGITTPVEVVYKRGKGGLGS